MPTTPARDYATGSLFCACVDAAAQVRIAEPGRLTIDVSSVHLFDLEK